MTRRRAAAPIAATALVLLLAGCGGPATGSTGMPASDDAQTLDVFAASSLTDVFGALARTFEEAHPEVEVRLNPGPSSGLARSITEGAPADVFASASLKDMATVVDAGAASDPRVFARNAVQVAVPADNPAGVTSLSDLARPGVKVAMCQAQVPCGVVAHAVLDNAGLRVAPVTEEADVRSTLTKVRLGEVDAALVYVSDVRAAAGAVLGIAVPDPLNVTTSYPVASVEGGDASAAAQEFLDLVLSVQGRRALAAAGFLPP